ncbi:uncharacterized protein LOC131012551 [Salvia miltiorrhiza]|uniref:uncharacterized protein LOC131012551 n=1 Tax=Salvia miltiorrhiza TaxID=226208 RepID=UPI0025ACD110|nr:uncharacterized protein LOC131012551 [Salvia miltiorrhiza]
MFNILFGWTKASKCKKLIKRVQCRLKLLKSKRSCIVKQLRNDVAELLKHGHDQAAFDRVEQVVIDENMVQVYDLLYQFCEFIIINLPYIRKHRDCPNDINEAASTLIFSSARFGELPELLSLRKLFGGRYGQKFVTAAIELLPGNLVSTQIIENLDMKSVPDNVKYKFLDEISRSCIEAGPLFLEYKPHLQENEMCDQNDIVRGDRERDGKIMYEDLLKINEENKFWKKSCFGLRKEVDFGNHEMETSSENSAKLGEEVIYLDDIEEFISPVIKDGNLQDQRLFVFKSFGEKTDRDRDKTESRNSRRSQRKRSRRRSLVRGTLSALYNEFAAYYGESDGSSPEIRRKSHHLVRDRCWGPVLGGPRYFSVGEVNGAMEAGEFSSAGRLALPPTALRAITMPCERPRESDTTANIDRSNSCPFSQSHDVYSPCRHIHPKLPDYDELAAKFMELKRANLEKK